MSDYVFAGIFAIVYGFFMAFLGEKIIDFLLLRSRYDLTFPDDIYIRGKNRKPFLFTLSAVSSFFMILMLEPLPLVFALIFTSCLIIVTRTDMEQYMIFDLTLLPYFVLAFPAIFFLNLPLKDHLLTALALFLIMLFFAVISRGGIGGGDVKLLALIGLWLGPDLALLTFAAGAVFGGVFSIILLLTKRREKGGYFAYGPFFTLSALVILAIVGFQG